MKLGVSRCLLGESVRHNGGHRLDRFVADTLGRYFDLVPVCPEVECGFGIPRETFRLEGDPESPRFVTTRTQRDHTLRMTRWARRRVAGLEREGLCGFVLKSNSPSCGPAHVKVWNRKGVPGRKGVGIFAGACRKRFPLVPVEDEEHLHDPAIRENFIERIFTLKRWRDTIKKRKSLGALAAFHHLHKLVVLSRSARHARLTARLLAQAGHIPPTLLYEQYQTFLLEALALTATVRKHCDVLRYVMRTFKDQFLPGERAEVLVLINAYRRGYVPLIVPITVINHYVREYGKADLKEQHYLHPHPIELLLKYHA